MLSSPQRQREVAIDVRGLSKAYKIQHADHTTSLGEQVARWITNPLRQSEEEIFWALSDISFQIKRGEVVGIIGRNGAGKSTLLKVLSRITEPTQGEAILYGRVGCLLEVGTGFHPELTGRENIYMNGAILGMTRAEIARQFDAIVDFSGGERFLDTPVKRYSSGMYTRLAFSVAAHLNPEILIVDEVLAVGDAEFQNKCLGKMQDIAQESGRTVIFVSHNESAVRRLCDTCVLLAGGKLITVDKPEAAFALYRTQNVASSFNSANRTVRSSVIEIEDAYISMDGAQTAELIGETTVELTLQIQVREAISVSPELVMRDQSHSAVLYGSLTRFTGRQMDFLPGQQTVTMAVDLPYLASGRYSLDLGLANPEDSKPLEWIEEALPIFLMPHTHPISGYNYAQSEGRGCIQLPIRATHLP